MLPKVFMPQGLIDAWLAADKVEVSGDVLTLRAGGGGGFRLAAASLFKKVSAGNDEAHRLVGKVKDDQAVAALGGEGYMTSVIVGDTAYEVEPGFLATVSQAMSVEALRDRLRGLG